MYKYEIYTDTFEFRMGTKSVRDIPSLTSREIFDVYFSYDTRITSNSVDPRREFASDSEEAAMEEFYKHYAKYGRTRAAKGVVGGMLFGDLAWLEMNEYDDEENLVQNWGTLCWSAEPYYREE